jgi:hypothetical protein
MGEEKLSALVQESLSVATKTGAAKPSDFSRVIVDTTVQYRQARADHASALRAREAVQARQQVSAQAAYFSRTGRA